MSVLVNKRSREEETLPSSPKRFHGRTEQQNLYTLEDFEFSEDFQETEENRSGSEEAVCADLRGFKEENGVMSSEQGLSGLSRQDESLASEGGIDLCYLVEASDDELGIPPTPVFDSEGQGKAGFPSLEEDSGFASDFNENADLKEFLEKWSFEDDFVDCTVFSLIEDSVWDDISSQGLFVDGDCNQPWGLETADEI